MEVFLNSEIIQKGVGNSTTISHDVTDGPKRYDPAGSDGACGNAPEKAGLLGVAVSVSVKTDGFIHYSHQMKLRNCINTTTEIYDTSACCSTSAGRENRSGSWAYTFRNSRISKHDQYSLFDKRDSDKLQALDRVVDRIREKYGTRSIIRGRFATAISIRSRAGQTTVTLYDGRLPAVKILAEPIEAAVWFKSKEKPHPASFGTAMARSTTKGERG